MRYHSITPPSSRNDSNSDGAKSVKEILLSLDPQFSRAVGLLNKYMPSDDSVSYNLHELNQNKAVGEESDVNTLSRTSQSDSRSPGKRAESEERGGSSMSDLHNTEYVDDSKDTKPHNPPLLVKTTSGQSVSYEQLDPTTTTTRQTPKVSKVAHFVPDTPVKSASFSQVKAPNKMTPVKSPNKMTPVKSPKPIKPEPPTKNLHKSTPRRSGGDAGLRAPVTTTTTATTSTTYTSYPSESIDVLKVKHRKHEAETDVDEDDDGNIDSDGGSSSDSETESESYFAYTAPDPSASRDLANASPKTINMCSRYPCHYCFFVYFPSATVDEDLMPFRRKAFTDKVARLQNPEHVREVKVTKCARDAYADRRLRCIERQSGTQIRLSELDPNSAFIKGLPRRRLTIAGPSFAHIACALNLFESLLPKIIKEAVFPYRLPEGTSTRFSAGGRTSSLHHWSYGRADGSVTLRSQLDDKGGWRRFLVSNRLA